MDIVHSLVSGPSKLACGMIYHTSRRTDKSIIFDITESFENLKKDNCIISVLVLFQEGLRQEKGGEDDKWKKKLFFIF